MLRCAQSQRTTGPLSLLGQSLKVPHQGPKGTAQSRDEVRLSIGLWTTVTHSQEANLRLNNRSHPLYYQASPIESPPCIRSLLTDIASSVLRALPTTLVPYQAWISLPLNRHQQRLPRWTQLLVAAPAILHPPHTVIHISSPCKALSSRKHKDQQLFKDEWICALMTNYIPSYTYDELDVSSSKITSTNIQQHTASVHQIRHWMIIFFPMLILTMYRAVWDVSFLLQPLIWPLRYLFYLYYGCALFMVWKLEEWPLRW